MGAPSAPVDICNLALDFLGQTPISSIDAPTTSAEETCARHYDQVRRQLLREWVWNFAKKRATISRTGDAAFDFDDVYALPNDCLRILSVGGENEIDQDRTFDIEGRTILCNNSGAATTTLRYIADITNPQQMDAAFINVLALALALKIAYKFTLKKGLMELLSEQYKADLPKAVTIDGQERPPRRIQRSKYLNARMMPGGYDAYPTRDFTAEFD